VIVTRRELLATNGCTEAGKCGGLASLGNVNSPGEVEFMAGDNFHRECVSVGQGVSVNFLQRLLEKGIIRTYETPEEARQRLRDRGYAA